MRPRAAAHSARPSPADRRAAPVILKSGETNGIGSRNGNKKESGYDVMAGCGYGAAGWSSRERSPENFKIKFLKIFKKSAFFGLSQCCHRASRIPIVNVSFPWKL